MKRPNAVRPVLTIAIACGLIVGAIGMAVPLATADETGATGTLVVEEGETVDEIEAAAGTVIVHGTVTGDVSAFAGTVQIHGEVGGDVEAAAGNIEITGSVDGDVSGAGGAVTIAEDATIEGTLEAAAGTIRVDGTVDGDASLVGDPIELGENASIAGDLDYAGTLQGNTDAVAGELSEAPSLDPITGPLTQPIAEWLIVAYTFLANLLLGAIVLALFPRFSGAVADQATTEPLKSGLAGVGVLIGVPILLVAIAITIIGIPLSIFAAVLFGLLIWLGAIYGYFAVAMWVLSVVGLDNRWLALIGGLLAGALLGQLPWIGGLLTLLVFLLGLGALSIGLVTSRRGDRVPAAGSGGPTAD